MKKLCGPLGLLVLLGLMSAVSASTICPSTTFTNTDCAFLITIGAGGSIVAAPVAGAKPYDSASGDDSLVGVINNSGATFTGSIHLTGFGNGGGLFQFDGDGICKFTLAAYCGGAATGYEGPINTFANITSSGGHLANNGDVVITGLADGKTTYFSLESDPDSINRGGGIGVPEPTSVVLLSSIVGYLYFVRRRRA